MLTVNVLQIEFFIIIIFDIRLPAVEYVTLVLWSFELAPHTGHEYKLPLPWALTNPIIWKALFLFCLGYIPWFSRNIKWCDSDPGALFLFAPGRLWWARVQGSEQCFWMLLIYGYTFKDELCSLSVTTFRFVQISPDSLNHLMTLWIVDGEITIKESNKISCHWNWNRVALLVTVLISLSYASMKLSPAAR